MDSSLYEKTRLLEGADTIESNGEENKSELCGDIWGECIDVIIPFLEYYKLNNVYNINKRTYSKKQEIMITLKTLETWYNSETIIINVLNNLPLTYHIDHEKSLFRLKSNTNEIGIDSINKLHLCREEDMCGSLVVINFNKNFNDYKWFAIL